MDPVDPDPDSDPDPQHWCTERNSNYLVIKFTSIGTQMLLSPYKYTVGILTYYCLSIQCADVCIIVSRYSALMFVLLPPDTER